MVGDKMPQNTKGKGNTAASQEDDFIQTRCRIRVSNDGEEQLWRKAWSKSSMHGTGFCCKQLEVWCLQEAEEGDVCEQHGSWVSSSFYVTAIKTCSFTIIRVIVIIFWPFCFWL